MDTTLYRRPLPADTIAFSSPEGRQIFREALSAGGLEGYFAVAEQFHTQAEPAYCGLGSLVVALNALAIDPGRLWKGPWRWFAEDLLDCCVPLEEVKARGLDLDELACLARCNGAEVDVQRASEDASTSLAAWRRALEAAARGDGVLVASYDRKSLGQTGSGHFSPVAGYHEGRDLALVLDVARFKYPSHWVSAERLWQAMQPIDPATSRPRGWLVLRRRPHGLALGFSFTCEHESWRSIASRLEAVSRDIGPADDLSSLARAVQPLAQMVERRAAGAAPHEEALAKARAALRAHPAYPIVAAAIREADEGGDGASGDGTSGERAEIATLLVLAVAVLAPAPHRERIAALASPPPSDGALADELSNLRAQLTALWTHAREQ